MRVLLTGGAGYIGSHTAKVLDKFGFDVVVVDNLSRGHEDFLKWGSFEKGDIRDLEFLKKLFKKYQFDGVIHFAALAAVEESVKDPLLYYDNNLLGTINLVSVMKEFIVRNIVFSSSCTVYGEPVEELCLKNDINGNEIFAIDEDHPLNPISPYGETKFLIERMLSYCREAWGLNYIHLRYFNAAGADPEGEVGEDHNPETHLIPLVLDAALGRKPSISIFGTDYNTLDGTCIRDYIHVMDLAKAHVLALEKLSEMNMGDWFNLGNGNGHSVREVIDSVRRVTGLQFDTVEAPRRQGDAAKLVASSQKITEILGFKADFTDIDEIVRTAFLWHKKRFGC